MSDDIVYEENSDKTRLRDALLVVEKSNRGLFCPYCNPPTRGKRKFQPVKLEDCKRLWDHGQRLSKCLTLVSEARCKELIVNTVETYVATTKLISPDKT